jgi:hypothetical protein
MMIIPEALRITKEIEPIFTGFILLLLILLLPNGLLSLFSPKYRNFRSISHIREMVKRMGVSMPIRRKN